MPFDSASPAFYYMRILENPSCRWSQFTCNAAEVDCDDPGSVPEGLSATVTARVLTLNHRHAEIQKRVLVLAEEFQVEERTIRRWQRWWRDVFVDTRFWMEAKARFMPPVDPAELPSGLVRRFGGLSSRTSIVRFLTFLAPLTAPRHLADQFSRTVRALLGTQRLTSRLDEAPQ